MLCLKLLQQQNYSNISWILFVFVMVTSFHHPAVNAKSFFSSSSHQHAPPTAKPNAVQQQTTEVPSTTAMPPKSRDITLGPCVWAIDRTCPDKEITFYLYTRKNPTDRQYIYVNNMHQSSNLSQSFYDPKHPSKILIHGYNADMFLHPLHMMKNEYLAKGEYNIFYVDWSKLAIAPCYVSAVHNIRHAGECVGQLVQRIADMGSKDIHAIGFSLGAQLTNYIANSLGTFVLPRITALDPAMPLFITSSNNDKLDSSDADYVDVIHTNAMVQGKVERCGHADFYMNGGIVQPGCATETPSNPFACSHHRAIDYYLESIRTTKGFWGWACSSYISYLLGMCPPTNYLLEAGENIKKTTKGMFFVNTNDKSPFALGKWTDLPTLGVKNPNETKPSPATITIVQPQHRGDPLLKHIDQWGKLDYNFNNNNNNGYPTMLYDQEDQYEENWTYFNDGHTEIENDVNVNSVEEQEMEEYSLAENVKINNHASRQKDFVWQEYIRNASQGFIDSSLFSVPILGRN